MQTLTSTLFSFSFFSIAIDIDSMMDDAMPGGGGL